MLIGAMGGEDKTERGAQADGLIFRASHQHHESQRNGTTNKHSIAKIVTIATVNVRCAVVHMLLRTAFM